MSDTTIMGNRYVTSLLQVLDRKNMILSVQGGNLWAGIVSVCLK